MSEHDRWMDGLIFVSLIQMIRFIESKKELKKKKAFLLLNKGKLQS